MIPVAFMGFPIVKTVNDDEALNEELKDINEKLIIEEKKIHIQSHRDGTIWVYPRFDSRTMTEYLEFITDDAITDIIKDPATKKPIAIYTEEQIKIKAGPNRVVNAKRTRIFTAQKITEEWSGALLPDGYKNKVMRNPIGILPIPFPNNADGDEIRGYPDYERVVSILKSYHDLSLAELEMLAKFKVKMIQNVNDVDAWVKDNSFNSTDEVDPANIDLIFNLYGKESTDFKYPERAAESHEAAMKRLFRLLVESSGVPEICWGIKTEGNANTAEEQMATLIMYVKDKQREKVEPYEQLFSAILRLRSMVNMAGYDEKNIVITWNELEAVSDKTKSEIFRNFATGLASIIQVAGLTKQQLYNLWKLNFPQATQETYEDFLIEIENMAHFAALGKSSLEDIDLYKGGEPQT